MEGEMEEFSGRTRSYPRDFLRRFAETSCYGEDANKEVVARADAGEIELSLGLSLNGCFGVDTKEKRLGLVRSSSIASLPMLGHHFMDVAPLTRTCSLPTEAEEELRKREEMQRLKRLQAKRKRAEKRNSSKPCAKDLMDESVGEAMHERRRIVSPTRTKSGRMEVELNGCSEKPVNNQVGRPVNGWPAAGGWVGGQISRQVSIGSQGSAGSSCLSDFEHHPFQEDRLKPSPTPLLPLVGKPKTASEQSCKKTSARANGMREMERNVMEEMPCVSTKGDGPNGRRIEGFLYKYRKGEEVRIVCVCHGRFLTPAEFVRHAGGGDVDHPLRHIVVYPTSSSFL